MNENVTININVFFNKVHLVSFVKKNKEKKNCFRLNIQIKTNNVNEKKIWKWFVLYLYTYTYIHMYVFFVN